MGTLLIYLALPRDAEFHFFTFSSTHLVVCHISPTAFHQIPANFNCDDPFFQAFGVSSVNTSKLCKQLGCSDRLRQHANNADILVDQDESSQNFSKCFSPFHVLGAYKIFTHLLEQNARAFSASLILPNCADKEKLAIRTLVFWHSSSYTDYSLNFGP